MSPETSEIPKGNILVVDDDARNRRLLEGYLVTEGYAVRSATGGQEALQEVERRLPDVVLLDVMMPGMNGFEVCRRLKSRPETRLAQVILVTALDGSSHRVEGLDHGADDYLSKPVRRDEFLAKIRSLLRARKLVQELEDAHATLAKRNAQLEELEALKETLTQTLVHDLKNPLAALVGNLELLGLVRDEKIAQRVARCRTSASRIHRMILDLLDVSRLEEGRLSLQPEPVVAAELAMAAVGEAEVSATLRNVRVEVEASDRTSLVEADASVLRRILDNLLANAIEHSPAETTVRLSVRCREEGIEFTVTDQGPGIPPEAREQVFEKYARLDLQKSGVTANRGLGLTFCRLAVEAHGGTIWVESGEQGGAMFRVLLPAAEAGQGRPEGDAVAATA